MVELIVGTYGVLCWLLLVKFKVVPLNVYTIFTAMAGGVVILVLLYVLLSVFHPVSHDGRMYVATVEVVPNVRGTVVEVPVKANQSSGLAAAARTRTRTSVSPSSGSGTSLSWRTSGGPYAS